MGIGFFIVDESDELIRFDLTNKQKRILILEDIGM
jgi:hypothetical protein